MRLNLHILKEDLADLELKGELRGNPYLRSLGFATFYQGTGPLKADRLYVMEASLVPEALSRATERLSIISVGEPQGIEGDADQQCSILSTLHPVRPSAIVDRVNQLFAFYADWIDETERAFALGKPLRRIAEQSEAIFENPIWMWDAQLQTVFHVVSPSRYRLPDSYQMHEDGRPWPASEVNAVNDAFRDALRLREPYVLPPMFGYLSLCFNLYDDGAYAATLAVDNVSGRPFTMRDKVLIQCLGERMVRGLKYEAHFSKHATYAVNEQMEQLLAGHEVPPRRLSAALTAMGWSIDDSYFCVVAHQRAGTSYPDVLMIPVAERICDRAPATAFSIASESMVFVTNLSLSSAHPETICEVILAQLSKAGLSLQLGVSTPFDSFSDLPFFRNQAHDAIHLGEASQPEGQVFMFHDHMLEAVVQRCTAGTVPETLYPPELSRLLRYDRANGTDLTETLAAYLANDASTKKTAEALYMHRNTLLGRLKKVEEVSRMDLESGKARLLMSIALALREAAEAR